MCVQPQPTPDRAKTVIVQRLGRKRRNNRERRILYCWREQGWVALDYTQGELDASFHLPAESACHHEV